MDKFNSAKEIYLEGKSVSIKKWYYLIFLFIIIVLFLPWTQNIRARGTVTALKQEQRPQQINTIISGRIEQWYIKEGDFVKKGDTILRLSEIKADYLDPQLLQRTNEQITAKTQAVDYYEGKINAAASQMQALKNSLAAKKEQLYNKMRQAEAKILSDSMDMISATNDFQIARLQYARQKALHDSGLVALTQLEQRNQSFQSSLAKKTSAENRFFASKQELNIIRIEFSAVQQEYTEKISKAESDRYGSLSQVATSEGEIAKLKNLFASYTIRNGMYFIIAPQDGQIVKAFSRGIGEVVKEGDVLVHIVPEQADPGVELFIRPVDLPLVSPGQKVRFLFDGFPAIVFSGWPEASFGTFTGIVTAIEGSVSDNGKFKILIREDDTYKPWPKELMMGTGASGIALLKEVPIWYELWRNINSFPPDYYKPTPKKDLK